MTTDAKRGAAPVADTADPVEDVVALTTDGDVVLARKRVRECAIAVSLDLVGQTKIVTAASELARNVVVHGRGGSMTIVRVDEHDGLRRRIGLRLTFTDQGPGIADLEKAMTGGWSSGTGLGLGLPGSQRLVHEFAIRSEPGVGTTVEVAVWRRD